MRGLVVMRSHGWPMIFDATHRVQFPGAAGWGPGRRTTVYRTPRRCGSATGVDAVFVEVRARIRNCAFEQAPPSSFLRNVRACKLVSHCAPWRRGLAACFSSLIHKPKLTALCRMQSCVPRSHLCEGKATRPHDCVRHICGAGCRLGKPALVAAMLFCGADAQSMFEVASVRVNRTSIDSPIADFSPGGERLTAKNIPLGQLIAIAYGLTPHQIAPIESSLYEKYDIEAKADHPVHRDEMGRMLQSLLADRFKLVMRHELRELPVYVLVLGKGGPKLQPSPDVLPWSFSRAHGVEPQSGRVIYKNESMPDFAAALSTLNVVGRVVVDKTGLTGNYDFDLTFAPPDGMADRAFDRNAPSIFTAVQEQLGLKLESQKAPVDFFVIEHVEAPSGN